MTKETYQEATRLLGEIIKWERIKQDLRTAYKEDDNVVFKFAKDTDKEFIINTSKKEITSFVYENMMEKIESNLKEAEVAFAKL